MSDSDSQASPSKIADSKQGRDAREKRTSRACLNCRARKSACHLPKADDGTITTPCQRCKAVGLECVIGSSNRGGRRVRKKPLDPAKQRDVAPEQNEAEPSAYHKPAWAGTNYGSTTRHESVSVDDMQQSLTPGLLLDPALRHGQVVATDSSGIAFSELQNTSDALDILAQIASNGDRNAILEQPQIRTSPGGQSEIEYSLIRDGKLTYRKTVALLERYRTHYHTYYPLVPSASLDPANLAETARVEPHLLTAMLVMASRDLIEEPELFTICSSHMRAMVSDLAAGGAGNVEAVEALLLLAEWTPYTSRSDAGHVGRGEEDREAWMHVGTALRIAYFLGLDRYAFAVRVDESKDPLWQRKRLVWAACYISDRQISIRLGRAFWSRGPGPLNTLRRDDFPMLKPVKHGDEDFASIFQASLELTMIFSNVHDVLYANPGHVSMRNHLSASSYIKYIDDFRTAIYGWKSVWDTLTCAPHLKATLRMSYDYLRLYTNAFAFHSTVKRVLPQIPQGPDIARADSMASVRAYLNSNLGFVGDSRFIYEGLDAAKSLLSMVNNFVDPERSLRYMPLRFYLYSIYSGVFLYRARCVGLLAADEELSVRAMITETVDRLERSAIGQQHPGSRYSQLLKLLWERADRHDARGTNANGTNNSRSMASPVGNPYRLGGSSSSAKEPSSTTEIMGDFAWTDLDAIGDFAVNGGSGNARQLVADADFWSGFLPADNNTFLFNDLEGANDWNLVP